MKNKLLNVQNFIRRYSFTFTASFIVIIVCTFYGIDHKKWKTNEVINNDACIYYAYLPASFIYNDLTFSFTGNLPPGFEGRIWLLNAPNGHSVLKMSCGNAICWLPFFGMAHLYTTFSKEYSADGYSEPYSFFIFVASLFYLTLGIYFLSRLLLQYFHDLTVGIVIILIVLATNLIYYVIQEPGSSHINSFGLICAFLYACLQWLDKPTYWRSVLIGLLAGMITLIRPTDIIVCILPLFIGISNKHDILPKLHFLKDNIIKIIIAGIAAFIVFAPQLIYWKYITGHYLYYSYQDQGFFFNHPHIIDGLFSYRKGWLLYTPIMAFAIAGFIFLGKYVKGVTIAFSIFLMINIYLIFSWWCWWYGGSFGSRPMIDSYGIMAFPLAALVEFTYTRKQFMKFLLAPIFAFLFYLNQFQLSQYCRCIIHWDSMSKKVYWGVFLTNNVPSDYQQLLEPPDINKALKGMPEK
jgi:hypothetical protein